MSDTKSRAAVYTRKYRYGITEKRYNDLLTAQNNKCAVCRTDFSGTTRPNVDHDHNCCPGTYSCGKCLRGLLCSKCITIASLVETRFKYMDDMFIYLTRHLNILNGGEI